MILLTLKKSPYSKIPSELKRRNKYLSELKKKYFSSFEFASFGRVLLKILTKKPIESF